MPLGRLRLRSGRPHDRSMGEVTASQAPSLRQGTQGTQGTQGKRGKQRGQLRIYLGAAAGVGKTYAMLCEGHRRAERGADVVVAFAETHGRPNTAARLDGLEVI